jgi:hypothetical protein
MQPNAARADPKDRDKWVSEDGTMVFKMTPGTKFWSQHRKDKSTNVYKEDEHSRTNPGSATIALTSRDWQIDLRDDDATIWYKTPATGGSVTTVKGTWK